MKDPKQDAPVTHSNIFAYASIFYDMRSCVNASPLIMKRDNAAHAHVHRHNKTITTGAVERLNHRDERILVRPSQFRSDTSIAHHLIRCKFSKKISVSLLRFKKHVAKIDWLPLSSFLLPTIDIT